MKNSAFFKRITETEVNFCNVEIEKQQKKTCRIKCKCQKISVKQFQMAL